MEMLKPCPFCGGKAILEHETRSGNAVSIVRCESCGSKGEYFYMSFRYAADI